MRPCEDESNAWSVAPTWQEIMLPRVARSLKSLNLKSLGKVVLLTLYLQTSSLHNCQRLCPCLKPADACLVAVAFCSWSSGRCNPTCLPLFSTPWNPPFSYHWYYNMKFVHNSGCLLAVPFTWVAYCCVIAGILVAQISLSQVTLTETFPATFLRKQPSVSIASPCFSFSFAPVLIFPLQYDSSYSCMFLEYIANSSKSMFAHRYICIPYSCVY